MATLFYLKLYLCGKLSGRMKLFKYILVALIAVACASGEEVVSPQVEEALYHFYTGQSYQREHKYYEAMEEFLQAEQLCAESDKVVLKGQICWHKGCLYAGKFDYANALEMFSKANEWYQLAGSDVREFRMYTFEEIAKVYAENGNPQESVHYYKEAMELAVQMRAKMLYSPHDSVVVQKENLFNDALMKYSTAVAAQYCLMEGGEDMALAQLDSTYNKFNDSLVNPTDYPLLAKIWLQKGNPGRAAEYLGKYSGTAFTPDDLLELYDVSAKVALHRGDFRGASANMQRYIVLKDSLEFAARSESVREAEQQFWLRQLEEENYNMKVRNHYLVAIYVLLFIVIAGGGWTLFVHLRRKFRVKDEQLAQYVEAIDTLGTRVSSAESTRENLLSQLDVQKAKEKELKDLLENRFAEVRELIRTYYEFGNSKKLQKKVDDLLKLQLSGDNFEVMEQVVNAKNNDVIKKVRERFPNMKEDNLKLLNLIYAGFSAQEISVILNDTTQNIYVRKSRLKKSLQELILEEPQLNF